jgi:hypothetical protein
MGYTFNKWVFDISENCDDEPSNPPWYPAGVCVVYNTHPTIVYIPSEPYVGLLRTLYPDIMGIFTSKLVGGPTFKIGLQPKLK